MSEKNQAGKPERRGRAARIAARAARKPVDQRAVRPGFVGGKYKPLAQSEMEQIHRTALRLLEEVGLADAILCYPASLVEDIVARAPRSFVMPGQSPEHDLEIGGQRVHTGTGGAAPLILDFESGAYRPSATVDIYDLARLVDTLDNIHYFWRPVHQTYRR